MRRTWMGCVLGFAVCVIAAGCAEKKEAEGGVSGPAGKKDEKPPVIGTVDLQVLSQNYRANEASAGEKYTSRRMTCEAVVHAVKKTTHGEWLVTFDMFVDGFNMREGDVIAYFPDSEGPKLAKFEYRSPMFFSGRCDGRDSTISQSPVVFRACRVEPFPKDPPKR